MNILDILAKIGFDWRMAAAQLVNFLIIYYLVKRYLFPPLVKAIQERQKTIEEGVNKAKEAETKLMLASQEYEDRLSEARAKAREIINSAYQEAEEITKQARGRAEIEAKQMIKAAQAEIDKQREQAERELRAYAVKLATLIAEKLMRKSIDEQTQAQIIKELSK